VGLLRQGDVGEARLAQHRADVVGLGEGERARRVRVVRLGHPEVGGQSATRDEHPVVGQQ
jgi:hypothetical protein